MEALEAYALPSSRLANEAAGTTTRFIQDSPHLLSHTGCELRLNSISGEGPLDSSLDGTQIRRRMRCH
jgi:hypothetical protein